MPQIEITEEQARELAAGRNITLRPQQQGKPVKNVLLAPNNPTSGWQHQYFCYEGKIKPGGDYIQMYSYVHLINAYGKPIFPLTHTTGHGEHGLWLTGKNGFKING